MWAGEFASADDFPKGSRSAQLRWLGETERTSAAVALRRDLQAEADFETATKAGRDASRRMVHNDRFLKNTLKATAYHNKPTNRAPSHECTLSATATTHTKSVISGEGLDHSDLRAALMEYYRETDPAKLDQVGSLLREFRGREAQLYAFLQQAKASRGTGSSNRGAGLSLQVQAGTMSHPAAAVSNLPAPGSKLKLEITESGVMGIRLGEPQEDGWPCVKSVTPRCEAARKGLIPGYLLKNVQGIDAQVVEYKMLLGLITSLERPVMLKFYWPGPVDSTRSADVKERSNRNSSKKEKKHKKDKTHAKKGKRKREHREAGLDST